MGANKLGANKLKESEVFREILKKKPVGGSVVALYASLIVSKVGDDKYTLDISTGGTAELPCLPENVKEAIVQAMYKSISTQLSLQTEE